MGIIIYFVACGIILPIIVIYALIWAVRWVDGVDDERERLIKETDELIKELSDRQ